MDHKAKRIFRAVQLRAAEPASEVCHELGCSDQVVRYNLRNLLRRGLIERTILINYARIGLQRYNMFFSVASRNAEERDRFLNAVRTIPQVCTVAAVGGAFDFEISFLIRSMWELTEVLEDIALVSPPVRGTRAIATVRGKCLFGTRTFDPKQRQEPLRCDETPLRPDDPAGVFRADDLDYQILQKLSTGCYTSIRELARGMELAPSKLHYRLDSLRRAGVIVGHYYRLKNSSDFGLRHYIVLVTLSERTPGMTQRVWEFASRRVEVDILTPCAGHHDFEITVQARHGGEVEAFKDALFAEFGSALGACHLLTRHKVFHCCNFPLATLSPAERLVA